MLRNLIVVSMVSVAVAGCSGSASDALMPELEDKRIRSTVNGVDIPAPLFNAYLEKVAAGDESAEAAEKALRELENSVLMADLAVRSGLADDADTRIQLALQKIAYLAQRNMAQYLENNPISEAEINEAYQKRVSAAGGAQLKIRHILLADENDALRMLDGLLAGTPWTDVETQAKAQLGNDRAGELGWFDPGSMPPALSEAVRTLRVGDFNKAPVATRFGHHILYVEDSRPFTPPPLEQVRDGLVQQLRQQRTEAYLQGLRSNATVVRRDP